MRDDHLFEIKIEKGFNVKYATDGMTMTNGVRAYDLMFS